MAVKRRTLVHRSTFKNLPFGAIYFLTPTSGPFVKMTRTAAITANSDPQLSPSGTPVAVNTAVIRVDPYFLRTQSHLV
jgi:hypothetical protein